MRFFRKRAIMGKIFENLGKMNKIWKYFEKGQSHGCDYCVHEAARIFPGLLRWNLKVGINATCKHFKSWLILKDMAELAVPFGTISQWPWHPSKGQAQC